MSDIDLELTSPSSSSKSDSSDPDEIGVHIISTKRLPQASTNVECLTITNVSSSSSVAEDDELGDGLRTGPSSLNHQNNTDDVLTRRGTQSTQLARTNSLPWITGQVERRRRKLPEIPKNKKCKKSTKDVLNETLNCIHF